MNHFSSAGNVLDGTRTLFNFRQDLVFGQIDLCGNEPGQFIHAYSFRLTFAAVSDDTVYADIGWTVHQKPLPGATARTGAESSNLLLAANHPFSSCARGDYFDGFEGL